MVAGLIVCLPLHYAWRLAARRSPWPRRFLAWVGRSAGLEVRTVSRPSTAHVLFLANHLSWLDILALAGPTGAAFVAKAELADWPVVGWLAGLNDTVYVARAERSAVQHQAHALRDALQSGRPVALFPEGTTEGGEQTLPFRASLLAALYPILPEVRVQPVAIDYGSVAPELLWVGNEGAWANARRLLSRRGKTIVTLHFLEPLDPAAHADRKALAQQSRADIIDALEASALAADHL